MNGPSKEGGNRSKRTEWEADLDGLIWHSRMGNKTKKGVSVLIKLVSMAGTGFFYVKKKNPRTMPEKLQLRKYDPRVKQHVLFSEQKMR